MDANAHGERGIAIGFILLAVILVAAIGASIAVSARGKTSARDAAKSYASAILQEGTNLRIASQRMVGDGVVKTAAFITLDTDVHTGLYNPAFGYLAKQYPPAGAQTAPADWQRKVETRYSWPNIYAWGGVTASDGTTSTAVFIPNLTKEVCSAINYALFADRSGVVQGWQPGAPVILYGGYSTATWETNGGFSAPTGYYQQRAGCVDTTDTPKHYVYYIVIEDSSPGMWGP
jgi:hypothetical protein